MKRIYHIAIFITTLAALTACSNNKEQSITAEKTTKQLDSKPAMQHETIVILTDEQYKAVGLTTESIEKRSLSGLLKVNGFLDVPPQNLVSVTMQIGGIVQSTHLLQGSFVKKGEVIAVLQNQDYVQLQQDYLDTKSKLEYAEAEYKRQQELDKENVNAQKTLQQAKAQYYSLLAAANGIKQKLLLLKLNPDKLTADNISGNVNVYAPTNGYVTKVNVNIGKYVNANDALFEIVNGANLHVELNVFEKDIPKIKAGQKVRFTLANEATERTATITLIGKEINADKTVRVHAIANDGNSSSNFIPGTYLSAKIETVSNMVNALPDEAVVDFEGKKYIFIEKENQPATKDTTAEKMHSFEITEVTTGISEDGFTEVQLPGSIDTTKVKIVIKGAYDLLSKLKNSEE